jgi:hypothetical protein
MIRTAIILLITLAILPRALAHDSFEITATVYLHTNHVELRAIMLRKTIQHVAENQGVHLLDFSIPSERDEAMPSLRAQAPGLFALMCGTNSHRAAQTNVTILEEDHVAFSLIYPATNAAVKLGANLLSHLPADDPYAISITVLDMENNKVVAQTTLNVKNPRMDLTLPAQRITPKPTPIP